MKQGGKKTGRFADIRKDPRDGQGLDWDAIRANYEARLEAEYEAGIRDEAVLRHQRLKALSEAQRAEELAKLARRTEGRKAAAQRVYISSFSDPAKLAELLALYDEGRGPHLNELSAKYGVSKATIRNTLLRAGVWTPANHTAKPATPYVRKLKTHCKRGHELTEENTYTKIDARGYIARTCRLCRKARAEEGGSR